MLIWQEVASRYLSGRYITVGKIYREWLNAVVNRVKESSLANYRAKFEKHILPIFGDVPCADLSAGRINAFINHKLAEGLSASYVRDIFTVFKSMLRYAQEEYGFKLSLKNVVLPKIEKKAGRAHQQYRTETAYRPPESSYVVDHFWYLIISLYWIAYR